MTPNRQIITADSRAWIDLHNSYPVDVAALAAADIAFVAENNGARWVEYQPFTGPVTQIDTDTTAAIDAIFADADQQHADHLAALEAAQAEEGSA